MSWQLQERLHSVTNTLSNCWYSKNTTNRLIFRTFTVTSSLYAVYYLYSNIGQNGLHSLLNSISITSNHLTQTPKFLIFQLNELDPPQLFAKYFQENNISFETRSVYYGRCFEDIKDVHDYAGIVVLGALESVNDADKCEWIKHLKQFVQKALFHDIPIFGACFGCQLLAHCVGGKVFKGRKGWEIGCFHLIYEKNSEQDPIMEHLKKHELGRYLTVFHEDTFSIPTETENVELLASTETYATAIKVGKHSYGFQAHVEMNEVAIPWLDLFYVWSNDPSSEFEKLSKERYDAIKSMFTADLEKKKETSLFLIGHWAQNALKLFAQKHK